MYYHLPLCKVVYHFIIFGISGHWNINASNESGSSTGHSLPLTRENKGSFNDLWLLPGNFSQDKLTEAIYVEVQ